MPDRPPAGDLLTEGQRRHLVASLERIERSLRGIVTLLGSPGGLPPALFVQESVDLPAEAGGTIVEAVDQATTTLAELIATFGLAPVSTSHARTVQSLVLSSLVIIEDAASKNLRGYGSIHPELPGRLDPLLERLHAQVAEIGKALPGGERPR
ncbi:MAG TPA: hypothetical protein VMG41_06115 [Gemmatimonadales bacterium]|nr:hypothetical protein [Gemmatimonadales bacterium]